MTAQNSGAERKRKMPKGRPFKPGTSGNPGGRPKEAHEVIEAFRAGGLEYVKLAKKYARKGNMRALEVALAYAYGKPPQNIQLTGMGGGPVLVGVNLSGLPKERLNDLEQILNPLSAGEVPDTNAGRGTEGASAPKPDALHPVGDAGVQRPAAPGADGEPPGEDARR